MVLDSNLNFIENIKDTIKKSKSLISPNNNELVNWTYYSRVKTLKWVLEQNEYNNLNILKKIVLSKIHRLKKEKKKVTYRIDTIRIIEEIDILEFCLNAIIQDINRIKANKKHRITFLQILVLIFTI
jgi:hypothetical protein